MRIFKQAFETIGGSKNRGSSNDPNRGTSPSNRSSSIGGFYVDKKYQTPDFLFQSPKASFQPSTNKTPQRKVSLSKNFFSMLSSLERKILIQRHRSLELLDTLVNMYKQCVEAYDSVQDPIKYYFLDKIQSALEDPETWNIMGKSEQPPNLKRSEGDSDEVFHDIDESVAQLHKNIEKEELKSTPQSQRGSMLVPALTTPRGCSPQPNDEGDEEDHMRNTQRARSKKVTIIKQVHAETQHQNENMNNMMQDYQQNVDKADQLIKDALQTQETSLQDRLKRRGSKQTLQRKMGHSHTTGVLEAPTKDLGKLLFQE